MRVLLLALALWQIVLPELARVERFSRPIFIVGALRSYLETHGHLPPVAIRDRDGVPIHSWRVLILPQLELSEVYARYDFNEPWDGPNNRRLIDDIPDTTYGCKALGFKKGKSNYVAVKGPGTVWPDDGPFSTIPGDRTSSGKWWRTVWLLKLPRSDINWSQPKDLTVAEAISYIHGSKSSPWKRPSELYGITGGVDRIPIPATASNEVLEALFSTDDSKVIPCKADGQVDFESR